MKKYLIGLAIVLVAFFFRFNNLNWDENFHLHPDERFLTMVGNAMKSPTNVNQYFDQKTSLLNPSNIGYNFFVYGRFPLIFTKYLAVNLNLDNYNDFTILGRQLSAFFDLLIIILVIKTTKILHKNISDFGFRISDFSLWAGFFYAIAVLPIQLSHFFAVDTFLNFFMFGSFYFALKSSEARTSRFSMTFLSSAFFGLALACKVTALFILPLNLFFIFKFVFTKKFSLKIFISLFIYFIIYLLISYFTLRFADPYLFQNSSFFDPSISKLFIENIKSLQNMTVKSMDNWFPPMVQWLNKNTVRHSLINNIVFGLGIPYAISILIGMAKVVLSFPSPFGDRLQRESIPLLAIIFWAICFFIYQSIQVTPTLRYFIIVYPFFAIFAAFGINYLIEYRIHFKGKLLKYPKIYSKIFIFISVLILLLWSVMFSSIYFHKNTRVEASEWIYKNLPNNSVILGESWDDSLPLRVVNNYGKQFASDQLPVFDPDTPEKWRKMNDMLSKADYYVLSSNRGWGSITTVPKKYPLMSRFYNELLENKNFEYKKIKEFKPFYYRFFELPSNLVDESFTVYDHPTVLIYKNTKK